MASDYFLKLDGIKGESTDAKHKDEIELTAFSWGVSNSGSLQPGGGGGAGKATFSDFEVATPVTKAGPQLFFHCVTGKHISSGLLTVRKSGGGGQLEYLKFKFTDVLITSYEETGNIEDERPLDVVRFNYAKFEVTYAEQNAKGSAGTLTQAGWDVGANTKI